VCSLACKYQASGLYFKSSTIVWQVLQNSFTIIRPYLMLLMTITSVASFQGWTRLETGNLALKNYCISFWNCNIDIDNYCISFFENVTIWVRNDKIKNDTISYKTVQNGIFSRNIEIILLHVSVLHLYSKWYQTDNLYSKWY
jgi:hypothetical protein